MVPPRASLQAPTGAEESELLCVIGLTRHGDRTPKQKLKMKTTEPRLLALLGKNKDARAELKIKKIRAMEELTQIVSRLVEEKLRAADPSSGMLRDVVIPTTGMVSDPPESCCCTAPRRRHATCQLSRRCG